MRILQKHNIIDLFVWVDDSLPMLLTYDNVTIYINLLKCHPPQVKILFRTLTNN